MERLRRRIRERPALSLATMGTLLAGSIYAATIRPLQLQLEGMEQDLMQARSHQKQTDLTRTRLSRIKEEAGEHRKRLLAEGGLLGDGPSRTQAIHDLVQLVLQRDLRPTRVSPAAPVVEDPLTHWPLELVVEGGFHDLGRFFQDLAGWDEIVKVRRLSISSRRDSSRPDLTLAASISLSLFQISIEDFDPTREPELQEDP